MKQITALVLLVALLWVTGCSANPDVLLNNGLSAEEEVQESADFEEVEEEAASSDTVFVYICGAVASPGVYEVEADGRVYEVVQLAGGLREDADEQSVNLAETVEDGEMIYIYTVEERAAAQSADATSASSSSSDGKININTASAAELTALSGIGDAKAAAIVAYRQEHGSFSAIEEITNVSGIGESTYSQIKEYITV